MVEQGLDFKNPQVAQFLRDYPNMELPTVDRVARAICDSMESDVFEELGDGITKAMYRQMACAGLRAFFESVGDRVEGRGRLPWK